MLMPHVCTSGWLFPVTWLGEGIAFLGWPYFQGNPPTIWTVPLSHSTGPSPAPDDHGRGWREFGPTASERLPNFEGSFPFQGHSLAMYARIFAKHEGDYAYGSASLV